MSWIPRRTISTTPRGVLRGVSIDALPLAVLAFAVVTFAGAASMGCMRSRRATYGTVPTVDARQVERLRRVGERDMRCPRGSLVMIPMTQNAVELRGCERIREYSLVCRRGRRCNWQPMTPAALLATRDLACPLEAMSVAAPSASTRDLVGCGRMGRYANRVPRRRGLPLEPPRARGARRGGGAAGQLRRDVRARAGATFCTRTGPDHG